MNPLLHKFVYAFNAITEEEAYGVLTSVQDTPMGKTYLVHGEAFTHVRKCTKEEIEGKLGTSPGIFSQLHKNWVMGAYDESHYTFAISCLYELEDFFTEEMKVALMIDDENKSKDNIAYGRLLAWTEVVKFMIWYREQLEKELEDLGYDEQGLPFDDEDDE